MKKRKEPNNDSKEDDGKEEENEKSRHQRSEASAARVRSLRGGRNAQDLQEHDAGDCAGDVGAVWGMQEGYAGIDPHTRQKRFVSSLTAHFTLERKTKL